MRIPAKVCSGCLVALGWLVCTWTCVADEVVSDKAAEAAELIRQLGDPSFTVREVATDELIKLGVKARAALEVGRRDPDPEIRFRSKRILDVIDFDAREGRFIAFLNAAPGHEELSGWDRFRQIVGDDKPARTLFVEMHRSEWDLLEALAKDPKRVSEKFTQRCEYLRQAATTYRQQLGLGSITTVIFLASEQDLKLANVAANNVYTFCYQNSFRASIDGGSNKKHLRKLLGRWVANNTEMSSAYQGLMLAMRHDLKEGLTPAKHILEKQGMPHHYKQYALLAVAKLGSKSDLTFLEKYFDDATPCSAMTVRKGNDKVVYQTQIRDVALAAAIHLAGQNVSKFGFERAQKNTQLLYNTNTLGFAEDSKRAKAFEKWKEMRASLIKPEEAAAEASEQESGDKKVGDDETESEQDKSQKPVEVEEETRADEEG